MHRTPRCLAQDNQITVLCTCVEKLNDNFPTNQKPSLAGMPESVTTWMYCIYKTKNFTFKTGEEILRLK